MFSVCFLTWGFWPYKPVFLSFFPFLIPSTIAASLCSRCSFEAKVTVGKEGPGPLFSLFLHRLLPTKFSLSPKTHLSALPGDFFFSTLGPNELLLPGCHQATGSRSFRSFWPLLKSTTTQISLSLSPNQCRRHSTGWLAGLSRLVRLVECVCALIVSSKCARWSSSSSVSGEIRNQMYSFCGLFLVCHGTGLRRNWLTILGFCLFFSFFSAGFFQQDVWRHDERRRSTQDVRTTFSTDSPQRRRQWGGQRRHRRGHFRPQRLQELWRRQAPLHRLARTRHERQKRNHVSWSPHSNCFFIPPRPWWRNKRYDVIMRVVTLSCSLNAFISVDGHSFIFLLNCWEFVTIWWVDNWRGDCLRW